MTPPPRPFKYVYRDFISIDFDFAKSEQVYELRGFDLEYVSRIFPSFVLEREDTRAYNEKRWQVIGEIDGEVFFVIYTLRLGICRLITAWLADDDERNYYYANTR